MKEKIVSLLLLSNYVRYMKHLTCEWAFIVSVRLCRLYAKITENSKLYSHPLYLKVSIHYGRIGGAPRNYNNSCAKFSMWGLTNIYNIINRPGVARAFLQTRLLLANSVMHTLKNIFKTLSLQNCKS